MDGQKNFLLNWTYLYQEKSMDELRESVLLSMELEDTRVKAREELKVRDEEIDQLRELLNKAIKERDEIQEQCEKLFFEKLLFQQILKQKCHQSTPNSGISSIDDDPRRVMELNNVFSSSDCEESIISSPHLIPQLQPPPAAAAESESEFPLVPNRPLPEKGKLLEAVIKAGPLLQTLLLAGPLPQWRHPPPPLDTCHIPPPPVAIPPLLNLSSHSIRQDSLNSNDSGLMINTNKGLSRALIPQLS